MYRWPPSETHAPDALAQPPQHRQAVDLGQAQVEHHAFVGASLQPGQCLLAIRGRVDAVAGLHELRAQAVPQQFVVFNNQQIRHAPDYPGGRA